MRILWVKLGGLWPLTSGGRIRSFQLVSALSRHHAVAVVTTREPDATPHQLQAALSRCTSITAVPHAPARVGTPAFALALARSWLSPLPVDLLRWRVPAVRRAVAEALRSESYDVCVADFLAAVPNLPARTELPVILFEHNVEHLIWARLARTMPASRRALVEFEWRKLRRYEAIACRRSALTIAVSPTDASMLRALAPGARIDSIPTGVDSGYYSPRAEVEIAGRVAFLGSMDWYPNEDAVLHLIESIFPLIRASTPSSTLAIVGRNPSERVRAVAATIGAVVTGTVDDVRPHVAKAQVLVVPLRVGSGTRLKIFEAMAMGKPVVSTTVGAEGLPITPGEHYLQEDDPIRFAQAVVELLSDRNRREQLGEAGRRLVIERFAWSRVSLEFAGMCEEILGPSAGGRV